MVGEFVCVCMCMYRWVSESVSEWCECGVCEWGMWEWVKWVSEWGWTTFEGSDVVLHGRRKGFCTLSSKPMACLGHFIRDVRRSGRWFPERGCILEHQIFRFAKMILRDRCGTSYDLASLFLWQAQYCKQMEWKHLKTHWYEAVSSAPNFLSWRKSRRIAFFWCCQVQKLKKSRRICFVFKLADRQIDRQLQLPLPLHYTTVTNANANVPRYIALH